MSNEFLDYIEDILDEISKLEILVNGITYAQFCDDFRLHYSAVRALEIMGEATKRLPKDV